VRTDGDATMGMKAEDWWTLVEPELEDVRHTSGNRYQAICPFHHGSHPSLSIDLGKANGVWYCHGDCKRGGSLQGLAIEFGWVEMEDGPARMEWLEPPYEYLQVEPDAPLTLRVIRWQKGLSKRPIEDPPGFASHLTTRFYVPPEDKPDGPTYHDFTNLTLIIRFEDILLQLLGQAGRDLKGPVLPGLASVIRSRHDRIARLIAAFDPASTVALPVKEAITLRLTRRGLGRDTRYDVEVLQPCPGPS